MPTDHRAKLASIKHFHQLIDYLRDEMGWPIRSNDFEELTFEYTPEELGIDPKNAAKIQEIKRLRPLLPTQPWGIFFVMFEPKRLPVVALRRILSQVALKRRASANSADRAAWAADDLLFVSNYGEGEERQISFAHFSQPQDSHDLPTLKVLGWDNRDTALHLDAVARELTAQLSWPDNEADTEAWRERWRAAFTLRHRESITTSKDLSIRLAELARNIRERIRTALDFETDKGPLTRLMKAFQTSLVHDLDSDGFADMYAQTISYGLLSARIVDPKKKTADDLAAQMRTNPFLRELMETFLRVGGRRGKAGGPGIDFDELGVSEVVQLLDDANMEAVVRDFGDRNPQEDPVIHFYELFLKEYDAKKRMQCGVFYTPRPVVSYIVRSVDELLRTEFGLEDGLADTTTWGEMANRHKDLKIPEGVSSDQDFVQILDPATGTGTFLVEVTDLIYKALVTKWKAKGFSEMEIDALWNEFVPKHLLTRLHGYELLMAPYAIAHLKIGLKLYETGYRFGSDERARVFLTNALEPAHDFSGTLEFAIPALAHEATAVNEVKQNRRFTVVIGNPPYSNFGRSNDNPWIRSLLRDFWGCLRGESKVNLYDDYIKFLRLAFSLRSGFGVVGVITNRSFIDGATQREMRRWLLSQVAGVRVLDLYRGIYDASAGSDDNVFAITTGVAISVWWGGPSTGQTEVRFDRIVGTYEAKALKLSAGDLAMPNGTTLQPRPPEYYLIPSSRCTPEYDSAAPVPALFRESTTGVQTNRDALCVAEKADCLLDRILEFAASPARALGVANERDLKTTSFWQPEQASIELKTRGVSKSRIFAYLYRPFDQRFIYYDPAIVHCPRELIARAVIGRQTICLLVSRGVDVPSNGVAFVANGAADKRCLNSAKGEAKVFPVGVSTNVGDGALFSGPTSNVLIPSAWPLSSDADGQTVFFAVVYAMLSAPSYLARFADALRLDFPRIPIPGSQALCDQLAVLGMQLTDLHLLNSPKLNRSLTEYHGDCTPEVEKVSWSKNTVWIDKAQTAGFKGVREDVWNFHIGGYQVCEKWLKDRKGRTLSDEDIAHYQKIVVALSETIRIMAEIDEVIEAHGGWPGAFTTQ